MRWLRARLRQWLALESEATVEHVHTHRLDTSPEHLAAIAALLAPFVHGPPGEAPGLTPAEPTLEEQVALEAQAAAVQRGADDLRAAAESMGTFMSPDDALTYARQMLLGYAPHTH